MLGLLFSIISFLLPKRIIGRFHFVRNAEEASKYISIDAIPEGLGGKMHFDGSFMPNGLNTNEFLKNGQVWERHNINNIPYEHVFVHSRQSFIRELDTKGKGVLLYEFHATRAFKVKLTNEKGDYLLPYLHMNTTLLSEEGEIPIQVSDGRIHFEIRNESNLFGMKLTFAFKFVY
uniref:Uncharacterized protein n=1 Tax=Meloidogyne enterolobii TaxID=390850 RepID=A0A6V7UEX2_MELEN|nr:unnamed protein product [Meloidogyne enterolobii]